MLGCYDARQDAERAIGERDPTPRSLRVLTARRARDDLMMWGTVEALRTVYEEHRGAVAEMDVEGDASNKLATHATP